MTDELNLTTEQFIITLAIIVIALALLLWYTGQKTWFVLPLEDDRTKQPTTDTVKARYGAYIQSRGRYYN